MNRISRWLVAALASVMLLVLYGGVWFYHAEEQHLRQDAIAEIQAIGQSKADQITAWRAERMGDASVLMESPFFVEGVARWMAQSRAEDAEQLRHRFRSLQAHYGYGDVLIVDPEGRVRLTMSGSGSSLNEDAVRTLAEALRTRHPVLSHLHTGPGDLPPHIDVVAPLFASSGEVPLPVGAAILRSNAEQFLYPLIRSWPTPSDTAETLLVRREGDDVVFLNELRHQPGAALRLRIPLSQEDMPAVMAVSGVQGVVNGRDYRGVEVLAYLRSIPDSSWFIVAKVDVAEALAVWRTDSLLIVGLILGLVAAVAAAAGVLWQRNAAAHFRDLFHAETVQRESEARYRTTLLSVGDGVIAADVEGRVELLNPVAEALTGWSQVEAHHMPIEEVFRIVNEDTRQAVENPVQRVIREGIVVGLSNHTLLLARDGAEHAIADSGAPIRQPDGALSGVVLVFRDQTQERAAQRQMEIQKERAQQYLDVAGVIMLVLDINGNVTLVNSKGCSILGYEEKDILGRSWIERFVPVAIRDEILGVFCRLLSGQLDRDEYVENWVMTHGGEERLIAWHNALVRDADGSVIGILSSGEDITERVRTEQEKEKLQARLVQSQKMEAIGRLAGGVAHDFNNMLTAILGYSALALKEVDPSISVHKRLLEIEKAAQRSADLTRQLLAFARRQTVSPRVLDLNHTVAGMLEMLRRLIGEDIELVWKPVQGIWHVRIDPSQIDQMLANLVVNARDAIEGVGMITIETHNLVLDEAYCARHAGFVPGEYVLLAVSDDGHGIAAETLVHIFEPFFTTKGQGQGTGLGLATVYGTVKQNDGFVNVRSEPGQGTTFKIYLPAVKDETPDDRATSATGVACGGTETVLLVEDESAILSLGQTILEGLGYTVLTASTPRQAIQLAGEHHGDIHLLITDVVMPGMNGREMAEQIRALRPGIRCLYTSGYTADVIAHRGVVGEDLRFIQKPFSVKTLADKVREALEG